MPPGSSTVEVVLVADGADMIVNLTHRDLPTDREPSHREGWETCLGGLIPTARKQTDDRHHTCAARRRSVTTRAVASTERGERPRYACPHPRATVQLGTETLTVVARVTEGEEREHLRGDESPPLPASAVQQLHGFGGSAQAKGIRPVGSLSATMVL